MKNNVDIWVRMLIGFLLGGLIFGLWRDSVAHHEIQKLRWEAIRAGYAEYNVAFDENGPTIQFDWK